MKAAIAREMGVTKSCVTKIARKMARLGPERSLKNSPGAGRSHKVLKGAGPLATCSSHLGKYMYSYKCYQCYLRALGSLNQFTMGPKAFLLVEESESFHNFRGSCNLVALSNLYDI